MDNSVFFVMCLVHMGLWSGYWMSSLWEPATNYLVPNYRLRGRFNTFVIVVVLALPVITSVRYASLQLVLLTCVFVFVSFLLGWLIKEMLKYSASRLDLEPLLVRGQAIALIAVSSPFLFMTTVVAFTITYLFPSEGWVLGAIGIILVTTAIQPPWQQAMKNEKLYLNANGKRYFRARYQTQVFALIAGFAWVNILMILSPA